MKQSYFLKIELVFFSRPPTTKKSPQFQIIKITKKQKTQFKHCSPFSRFLWLSPIKIKSKKGSIKKKNNNNMMNFEFVENKNKIKSKKKRNGCEWNRKQNMKNNNKKALWKKENNNHIDEFQICWENKIKSQRKKKKRL